MVKISVIIPCYNVSKYLDRCMESLVMQTIGIDKLEIILVDDASTDDTWDVIRQWENRYPDSIKAVHYDVNGRIGKARNTGLKYATGEWVSFIDSDDFAEPELFEKLFKAAIGNDCEMVCSRLKEDGSFKLNKFEDTSVPGRKSRLIVFDNEDKRKEFLMLGLMPSYACGKLIKKSFIEENELYFPERLAYEDGSWSMLSVFFLKKVYFLEEYLYHYFVNESSTVLTANAEHHIDTLTVHIMLWEEYLRRGLYPEYKDEIEYNFLYTCYLGFIKVLALRYAEPSYSQFLLMKQIVNDRIPDWRENRYIKNGDIKELHLALIEMLDKDVDRDTFKGIIEAVKRSGM